jgi:sec-independent protein translocase protein TatC
MSDNDTELESKPFLEHLEDFRSMVIKSTAVLALGVVLCFIYTPPIMEFLQRPLKAAGQDPTQLKALAVVDPFTMQMEISLLGGFVLTLPFILYFVGQFVLPALTVREKKLLLPVFAVGGALFLGGLLFCYYLLLPQTLKFFVDYNAYLGVKAEWTMQNYVDFVVQMLVGFGLAFELPLVVLALHWVGLVTSRALRDYRRHAVILVVIFAACITPTSDLFTLALLAAPMCMLYEMCVWIAWLRERRVTSPELAQG